MAILIGAPVINMDLPKLKDKYLLLDMGVKGAMEFKKRYKRAIFIYVIPPNKERLLLQMKDRDPSRLLRSKAQIPMTSKVCDWLVINDNPEEAAIQIERIMRIIKENVHNINNLDEDSLRFLYSCNLHNPSNREFLDRFYDQDVSYPEERQF